MEQILILIKQLYHQNKEIRNISEQKLNQIFNDVQKIRIGFEYLCNHNLDKSLKTQFFIFLKHFIQQNYTSLLKNHQIEIQQILLFYLDKVDQQIIPLLCNLINYMILNSLDSTNIIIQIINNPQIDMVYIQLITEMMNNQIIKLRIRQSGYRLDFNKIYNIFNFNNLKVVDLLLDLYISLTSSLFYSLTENEYNTIINQYCQFIQNNPYEQNLLRKFQKIIFRIIKRMSPSELNYQQLLQQITNNYLNNKINLDRIFAYSLLKILKQLIIRSNIYYPKQKELIIFIIINIIQLDPSTYQNLYSNKDDDYVYDFYLLKIRNFGIDFILTILKFDEQNHIFHEILQIFDQYALALQEESDYIKKEAHYYIISNLFNQIPIHNIDQLFLQELLCCLKQMNSIYIPIKIQILTLLKTFIQKQIIANTSQINYLLAILKEQIQLINLINNPNLLCTMIDLLICLHQFYPKNNCINQQIYFDLKFYYSLQNKINYKQNILKFQILEITLLSVLQIWNYQISNQKHISTNIKQMLINVMNLIVDIWPFNQLVLIQNIIFQLIDQSLKLFKHQVGCINLLNMLLRKLLNYNEIKQIVIGVQIRQIQHLLFDFLDEEPDQFENIVQAYYLVLLHDSADLQLILKFITKYLTTLINQNYLSLFSLFLFRLKQGQFEQEIQQLLICLYKKIEQDDGRLCSEILCGLSILDRNQYDIKEFMVSQQNAIETMINKTIYFIQNYNKYYINYLTNFYESLIVKKHLIFDMESLCLNNNYLLKLHEFIIELRIQQEETEYSIINQIQKMFEIKYQTRLQFSDSIIKECIYI
ncbi:unnamed protein product [Paramecium sonneborni]|uniref:Uncharacterized protein n=1 Tax=Paramecium sonneborni TaxID=65129 RepID=A0A8S1QMA2_9CILI|nr:unnamed protein product [Paramecium sonneborni]